MDKRAKLKARYLGVATKITDELFAVGDEKDSPIKRIEFKDYGERGRGGLCKTAMVAWLAEALERNLP